MDELQEYDSDEFKDTSLYVLYDNYRNDLELIKTLMHGKSADSAKFQDQWKKHMEERAKTLYDLNSNYDLEIAEENKDVFDDVLANSEQLVEKEDIEKSLSKIKALDEVEVVVEDNSISITYHTESALSADSFVNSKTGFPSYAMEILSVMRDYNYGNIVVSTINQDTIALSSYFTKNSLDGIDFDKWEDLDSLDAYKFYNMSDAYHIRRGIWEDLEDETKQLLGEMNKDNSSNFWKLHGYSK